MPDKKYSVLYKHYESTLEKHGANRKGMDWPDAADLDRRFRVMFESLRFENDQPISVLDLGCGVGLFYSYLRENQLEKQISYKGVDISSLMVNRAKELHPDLEFECRDILEKPLPAGSTDFIIMNGVLTEKREMSQDEMIDFATKIISVAFSACSKGIAFNVMSSHVDWKRDDLFHWELDQVVQFLVKNCSRKIQIRMDYGLYEYTVYVYR